MKSILALAGVLCLLTVAATRPCLAAEPWADSKLPVRDGLELWLDAPRLPAAYEANTSSPPRAGGGVAVWYDASVRKRDAAQDAPGRRPAFRTDLVPGQAVPVVAFDGRDDGLLCQLAGLALRDFTVFVVAAPFSNAGTFRGFLSANERGKNDYHTGINVDLGGGGSGEWARVNVEGRGFSGERDLLADDASFAFGTFHALALSSAAGRSEVSLRVDGKFQGSRPRQGGETLRPDELRVGYRFANPTPAGGDIGFLDGAVAEVLVYDGVLADAELRSVEEYLAEKHAALLALKGVPQRPVVQMLVPGFT